MIDTMVGRSIWDEDVPTPLVYVDSVDLAGAMTGLDLVLIVDTGYGRLGVASGEAADRAEEIATLPGVRFRGIRSHTGHAYGVTSEDARRKIAFEDARVLSELAT